MLISFDSELKTERERQQKSDKRATKTNDKGAALDEIISAAFVFILGVVLISAVMIIVLQLRRRRAQTDAPAPQAAPARKAKRKPNSGVLTVNGQDFEFAYKPQDEDEVAKTLTMVRHSIALVKESKYSDVRASRTKESESLIRRLEGCTSLDKGAIKQILTAFYEYAASL